MKIKRCLCFILILFVILFILSFIFVPKNNSAEYGMEHVRANGILGEEENSIDVLVIGDSESFTMMLPQKMQEYCGYSVYMGGAEGQVLPDTIIYLKKVLDKQKPKIVILETNIIFTRCPLTTSAIKAGNAVFPVVKYHDRWKKLNRKDFFGKKEYTYKDELRGYYNSTVSNPADETNYKKHRDDIEKISKSSKIYVKIINELCNKNGSKLILVSSPSTLNWNYAKHNALEEFSNKENIELLDLNVYTDEIGIDWSKDTRDKGDHLNDYGAEKVTDYMIKYLKEKNI